MTSSSLAHRLSFQDNALGSRLARLFVASFVVSLLSVGLSMVRLGTTSFFVIPAAFVVTLIHHIVLWRRLVKYKKDTATPLCDTPPCLKHAGNIWSLFLWSSVWLAGGSVSIAITLTFTWYNYWIVAAALDLTSASLAIIEGVLLMTIMAFCYRALGREGYAGAICTRAHKDDADTDAESAILEKI